MPFDDAGDGGMGHLPRERRSARAIRYGFRIEIAEEMTWGPIMSQSTYPANQRRTLRDGSYGVLTC